MISMAKDKGAIDRYCELDIMKVDAMDMGLAVIDAGHYGLEQVFIDDMERLLKEQLEDCQIISYKAGSPYQILV
jgi:hypothetical protein